MMYGHWVVRIMSESWMIFTWKGISPWKWGIYFQIGLKNKIGNCPWDLFRIKMIKFNTVNVNSDKAFVSNESKCLFPKNQNVHLFFTRCIYILYFLTLMNLYYSFGIFQFICSDFFYLRNFDEQSPDNILHTQELLATLVKKIDEHCSKVIVSYNK